MVPKYVEMKQNFIQYEHAIVSCKRTSKMYRSFVSSINMLVLKEQEESLVFQFLNNMICSLQLEYQLRISFILVDQILHRRFTTKNMLMLGFVDQKNGENHLQSSLGNLISLYGTTAT